MKIAILSCHPKGVGPQRLKQAAKDHGHSVRIIDYTKCYCNIEKNNPMVFYRGKPLNDLDAIIPRIATKNQSFGSAIIRQFEMMGVYSTTGSLAFLRARDKLRSLQLLARHGIDIPITVFARRAKDVDSLIDAVGGAPLIIKLARGSLGAGVMLGETRKAAKSIIQAFYSQNLSILIQEFINESRGTDVRAFVINGKVVAAMRRTAVGDEFRSNVSLGGTTEVIDLTKKQTNLAIRAAQAMNLQIAGVDILQAKRGPLVVEVNAFPGFEGIEGASGIDIAGQIMTHIEENTSKKRRRDKIGA
ncbi:MAG: 30S ribosomal protein S6--L-glutamate ligase [bacterium]